MSESESLDNSRPIAERGCRSWLTDGSLWVVAVVAALLCFARLDSPLQEPQEARYAEIPRQMLAEGQWLVPVLHGQAYLDKPPLFYWLVMASYRQFGVHDWAARLVAGSASFGCILIAYGWGRRILGARAGCLGALILCLSPRFLQLDRMVTMDGLLCLWIVSAWAAGYCARSDGRWHWSWWLISAGACGLGLLTKGPVALVLVLVPLVVQGWLDGATHRPRWTALVLYVVTACAGAAPWYLAVARQTPGFLTHFFWWHHVQRFVEPFDHEEPCWFYVPVLLGGMLPWTMGVPAMLRSARRQRLGMFLVPCLWCLLFYSLAGCKRAFYILPAMPPLALALGAYLDDWLPADGSWSALFRCRSVLAFGLTILAWCIGAGTGLAVLAASWLPLAAVLGAGGLVVLTAWGWCRQWRTSWLGGGLTALALALVLVYVVLPAYACSHSLRGLVCGHAAALADGGAPVICYPRRWDSVSFYLRKDDVAVYTAEQLPLLLAELERRPEAWLFFKPGTTPGSEFLTQLPPTLAFEPVDRQGAVTVGKIVHRARE